MTDLALPAPLLGAIRSHARSTYPDECCGFLLAPERDDDREATRSVDAVEPAANEYEGERRRRFVIRPDELRAAERRASASGRSIVGFYHSHPDHPARPSAFDQDHAWPWYTYVVLSITADDVPAVGAFELDPDTSTFREVRLSTPPGTGAAGPGVSES